MKYSHKLARASGKDATPPLYRLAKNNELPDHQFMDVQTLSWIHDNTPTALKHTNYDSILINLGQGIFDAVKYTPKAGWYQSKLVAKGIHGILHAYRVTVYLILLNHLRSLEIDKSLLLVAGMFHDIGRLNDKNDDNHGERSANWIIRNKVLIENYFRFKISDRDWKTIFSAVSSHNTKHPVHGSQEIQLQTLIDALTGSGLVF